MPPKFNSRQLAFDAGPVPPFLQKLHDQVNGRGKAQLSDKFAGQGDDVENLAAGEGGSSSKSALKSKKDGAESDSGSEEEWSGAQVVVVKDGKHITAEEAAEARRQVHFHQSRTPDAEAKDTKEQASPGIATAGLKASVRKRRTAEDEERIGRAKGKRMKESDAGFDELKSLIAKGKEDLGRHLGGGILSGETIKDLDSASDRKREKHARRQEKNRQAKAEKKKTGKGLSFSMGDEDGEG